MSLYSPDGSLLVRDLSFQVVTGQSVIIMGPNGRYVPIDSYSPAHLYFGIVVNVSAIYSWFNSRSRSKDNWRALYSMFVGERGLTISRPLQGEIFYLSQVLILLPYLSYLYGTRVQLL